jgi:putative hydrolase of the HAD superfamily
MLIDLDDTILSAYANPAPLWLEVATEFEDQWAGLPAADVAAAILASGETFWDDPERHRVWRQQMFPARREVVRLAFEALGQRGASTPSQAVQEMIADRFSGLREARYALFPGAIETLDALRQEGVLLALVTNGAGDIQRSKIERFGLARHFHHIQIEGECGFGKPEERCYRHALQALAVEPHEAWMVGDNLEWEVAAPQRIGIYSVWHDHAGAGLPEGSLVRPDRIIRSLGELVG